jgi:hypothetical protein
MTRRLLFAQSAVPLLRALAPEMLQLRWDDQQLRVQAPYLHFLNGKSLERLHSGAALVFSLQLSLSSDKFNTVVRRNFDRFVVSFDLWEEKFAITRLGPTKQQASHLSREAAERWVFDHTSLSVGGLADNKPLWLRLDLRADDTRESTTLLLDPTVNLARLIEWFGRAQRGADNRWTLDKGPFRLAELRR